MESTYGPEISLVNSLLPEKGIELDVASWPNPFYGVASETFLSSNQTDLRLVDGGEDGENIPLQPLLVKARGLDTILVIDAVSTTIALHSVPTNFMHYRRIASTISPMGVH